MFTNCIDVQLFSYTIGTSCLKNPKDYCKHEKHTQKVIIIYSIYAVFVYVYVVMSEFGLTYV